MDGEERRVEMLRIERKEEFYDRDEVLGRDVNSVFPTQRKEPQGNPAAAVLQEMLGTRSFVSQSELDEIKSARGVTGDEGGGEPLRPLAEVLRENREKKQQAFDDQWKQMKTGKNAPLDPEELEFLDGLAQAEAARLNETSQTERQELEEFRMMLAEQAAQRAAAEAEGSAGETLQRSAPKPSSIGPKAEPKRPISHYPRPNLKPVFRPKAQAPKMLSPCSQQPPPPQQQQEQQHQHHQQQRRQQPGEGNVSTVDDGAQQPHAKRAKVGTDQGAVVNTASHSGSEDKGNEATLAGLLGDYGSESDQEDS
ncbi:hypothetical protein DUNSADRAFT_11067 [Dunaliella salina]|uniref:FAM192A/Fyv6 N-terminal domain-containing protein n=1 Tax=Dunaliella salina TaxID=3046 RepID=A0ABQ7GE36_DUNSA|nr:hypothetical protein DUNSADRAFT_11067 [Dunaliella salina]|eukprot:KAF5832877.1 hypothetical protein DUNSADRAFT_11067 [Dunaliella salina]